MRTIYKQEFIKAVVSGTVKGIIVVSIILWGIRSTFLEVNIKRILLEKEAKVLEVHAAENIDMRRQLDQILKNNKILLKENDALRAKLKQLTEKNKTENLDTPKLIP